MQKFSQRKWKFHNNRERVVIPCLNHKTGPQGVAQLVANTDSEGENFNCNITPWLGQRLRLFLDIKVTKYEKYI